MKMYVAKLAVIIGIVVLALSFSVGGTLADAGVPVEDIGNSNRLAQMIDWMGQENWGQMVQHMTQLHGPEWTGQMIQWMSESNTPCGGSGFGHMMGQGIGSRFGGRFDRSGGFGPRGMMGLR